MAVARVQFIAGSSAGALSQTITLGAAVTTGNLLALWVGTYKTVASGANFENLASIVDNKGNQVNYLAVADARISLLHRATCFVVPVVAIAGLQTFTVLTSAPSIAYACEYSGLAGTIDVVTPGLVAFGTTWQSPALTTTGTGMISTYGGAPFVSGVTFAAGGSYTLLSETDNATAACSMCVLERLNTAAATYNPNGTCTSNEIGSVSVALK